MIFYQLYYYNIHQYCNQYIQKLPRWPLLPPNTPHPNANNHLPNKSTLSTINSSHSNLRFTIPNLTIKTPTLIRSGTTNRTTMMHRVFSERAPFASTPKNLRNSCIWSRKAADSTTISSQCVQTRSCLLNSIHLLSSMKIDERRRKNGWICSRCSNRRPTLKNNGNMKE